MLMGVVTKPIESEDFDGKIFLERVTRHESYKKTATCERFTNDGTLNACLCNGEWQKLLVDKMTLGELQNSLAATYLLDNGIVSRVVLHYYTPTGKDGAHKATYIDHEDHVLPSSDCVKVGGTLSW